MNNTKEAKELNPNQDLKINAGLMQMWKKAGLRVKSFKATKKGHNEIWSGEFKTKNATLSMSVDKYGSVFYHAGNKSVNIGRLDKQSKIIEWMKAIIRNAPWAESVNEAISWGQLKTFLISVSRSGAKNMDGVKINPQTARAILDYGNSSVSNRKKLEKLPIKKMISLVTEESVNEARQLRVGEAAKKGRWEVYDNKTDKTIKIVKNAAAATRLMNRLMDTGNYDEIAAKWIGDEKDESVNERKFHHKNKGDNYLGGFNDTKGNNTELWGAKDGTFYIWIQKKGGAESYIDLPKNIKDRSKADKIHHKLTRKLENKSIDEKIERGNEIHAETKKELKAAIARSMKETLDGKLPKYDIINGMTGEMIAWKDGKEYVWQPSSIPYAERELE